MYTCISCSKCTMDILFSTHMCKDLASRFVITTLQFPFCSIHLWHPWAYPHICNLVTFSTGETLRDSTRAFRRTVSTKYYLGFAFVIRIVKVDGVSIHKLLYNPV